MGHGCIHEPTARTLLVVQLGVQTYAVATVVAMAIRLTLARTMPAVHTGGSSMTISISINGGNARITKWSNTMSKIVLTLEQIKELARFATEEGQPSYTITTGTIPAFEAEDGEVPEYSGLIAYSDSENHSVLQLE